MDIRPRKMGDNRPRKLHVEITTRCNLQCRMCVKYAAGSTIAEGDMPLALFSRLLPSLAGLDQLILNGIGEPLLHADLPEMIRLARAEMAAEAEIGLQSNGVLLDHHRARTLITAGLSTICLSLDSLQPAKSHTASQEHGVAAVDRAIAELNQARRELARPLRIGVEMVLTRENLVELPELVLWAATRGVDYLLVSHLFLYDAVAEERSLFQHNPREASELFLKYRRLAAAEGVNLDDCLATYLKFTRSAAEQRLVELFSRMQQEAGENDIRLHLRSLAEPGNYPLEEIARQFAAAEQAARGNIALFLPPLQADTHRSCRFIEEQASFVNGNGDVMPCHFLWHSYACRVLGDTVQVEKRVFGNITRDTLTALWQSPAYQQFRREAGAYQYAPCWSCAQGPCADLVNDRNQYANDCYGSRVPCGHCQWSLGGVRCL